MNRFIQFHLDRPAGEIDDDADDLTQAFFPHFPDQSLLGKSDPTRETFLVFMKMGIPLAQVPTTGHGFDVYVQPASGGTSLSHRGQPRKRLSPLQF